MDMDTSDAPNRSQFFHFHAAFGKYFAKYYILAHLHWGWRRTSGKSWIRY